MTQYMAVAATGHQRLYKVRGKADHCVFGHIADRYHWANLTDDYMDPYDYAPMCISCHRRYDHQIRIMTQPDRRWRSHRYTSGAAS